MARGVVDVPLVRGLARGETLNGDPAALSDAVRSLVAAGYGIAVGRTGRVVLQPPLIASGANVDAAVAVVLSHGGTEVRRLLPKRPRPRRRPRPGRRP